MNSTQDPTIGLPFEHLTYDEIEAYVDGRADADDRAIVSEHLAQCALCRDEVMHLEAVNADMLEAPPAPRRSRTRWLLAAAAAIALMAIGGWLWLASRDDKAIEREVHRPQQPRAVPPEVAPPREPESVQALVLEKPALVDTLVREEGVLRGPSAPAFALLAPVGTAVLDERPEFQWKPAPDATSYDIAIADPAGTLAASGASSTARWRPDQPLARGSTYTWQVTAHTAAGATVVAPGPDDPEALFHVLGKTAALPADPLARGVALANLGALDDAERALAESNDARAAGLLKEVRSWRTPSQGLPTTTNGAQ
ncbi:MAG TPA: zf-HC2 domain-containing protein [Thermoanaerobaculia bacterium]